MRRCGTRAKHAGVPLRRVRAVEGAGRRFSTPSRPALRAASGRPPARRRHDGHGGAGVTQRSSLMVSERRHDSSPTPRSSRPSSSRAWRPPAPSRSGSTAPSNGPSPSAGKPWARSSARHEPPPHGTGTASPLMCSTTTSPSSRSSSRRVGRTVLGSRRIWCAWRIERQTGNGACARCRMGQGAASPGGGAR
jgi:hypothetical protein